MLEINILVRGKARDFDDIYEGTKLEVIAKCEELLPKLSDAFGICDWQRTSERRMVGSSKIASRTAELMLNKDDVIMLTINGVEQDEIDQFSKEMRLSILG
jgi:hypothetical protein